MRQTFGWIAFLLFATSSVAPHLGAQDRSADRFEVASIRPYRPNSSMIGVTVSSGGRVVLAGLPLKTLVGTAFGYSRGQVVNRGDAWIEREGWHVEAKAPADSGITNFNYSRQDIEDPRLRNMLQALLLDRFQLRVNRETKMGAVFHLIRTNSPLRVSAAKIPEGRDPTAIRGDIGYAGGRWVIRGFSMAQLAKFASSYVVNAPVIDMTNESGFYDYTQTVRDQDPNYSDNTDSFLRLLKEVGLELKRTRGSVETLVIETATRPSPN